MTGDASGAAARLSAALEASDSSARVRAAMTAGTYPAPAYVPVLVAQCRTEPDFLVREMLTWALTRHDADQVIDALLEEVAAPAPQARSQALHTLSKIGGPRVWAAITTPLLRDPTDEVARVAWRAAVRTAPEAEKPALARILATQFARGERDTRRSLSQAFTVLGDSAAAVVDEVAEGGSPYVRAHARITARMMAHPEESFDEADAGSAPAADAAPPPE
ncbi:MULTISPECIES: HEAT repeat domain-containing protein [unclassified Microbacterium]|uniref:HEAT repeat domain-containing protein n=1 Tax=unclassified Microbacterium TaxID=2609290 RepID=UPI0038652CAA